MYYQIKSVSLVTLQFLFIILLIVGSRGSVIPASANILFILSILLALWAILVMQKSKIRILPKPSEDAILIRSGPYRYIRHPMYTAIFLGAAGLLTIHFTILRLIIAIALLIILVIKLLWEEKMLQKKFTAYQNYMHQSFRLIPYLY